MPYYREQLLSVWSTTQVYEVGNPPPKIDPAILKNAQPHEVGLWAKNPGKVRRNQAEKRRIIESNGGSIAAPKFLSEKAREADSDTSPDQEISDIQDGIANVILSGSTKLDVPVMYRNVEIKYSRFGIDDFDFESVSVVPIKTSMLKRSLGSTTRPTTQVWRHISRTRIRTHCFSY